MAFGDKLNDLNLINRFFSVGESKSDIMPVVREGSSTGVEDNGSPWFLPVGHLFNGPASFIEDLSLSL